MSSRRRVSGTGQRRRRPLVAVLVVLLVVVPILEVSVLIAVGRAIGGWQTLALLLVESLLGAWLVRREGTRAWAALVTALQTGRMPSRELTDAALVLVGGTLLLTPGFVTDVVGFFFVLSFTRPLARGLLVHLVERRLLVGLRPFGAPFGAGPGPDRTVRGTVIDSDRDSRGQDDSGRTS